MKPGKEVFLDSPVFADHLSSASGQCSFLIKCMTVFDHCFTSVVNIAEVLSACDTKEQKESAKRAFYGTGLLGMPYRYSEKMSEVLKESFSGKECNFRDAFVITMCSEAKLPLVTFDTGRYLSLSEKFSVKLISRQEVNRKYNSVIKNKPG